MNLEVRVAPDIIDDHLDHIFTIESYLDNKICDDLIQEYKEKFSSGKPMQWRGSWSKQLLPIEHHIHKHLEPAWNKAIDFYGCNIDFIEQYNIKKYEKLDYYGSHIDNFISVSKRIDRKLTCVVQLNDDDDYVGGDLLIYHLKASRKKGSVIFFPSSYRHSVNQVKSGQRHTLIGWAWGKAFL